MLLLLLLVLLVLVSSLVACGDVDGEAGVAKVAEAKYSTKEGGEEDEEEEEEEEEEEGLVMAAIALETD